MTAAVLGVLILWGSLYLAFWHWRAGYRERQAFGARHVAAAVDPLAAVVPAGECPAAVRARGARGRGARRRDRPTTDAPPDSWRRAVAETHALLVTLTAANVLDRDQMAALRGASPRAARARPATSRAGWPPSGTRSRPRPARRPLPASPPRPPARAARRPPRPETCPGKSPVNVQDPPTRPALALFVALPAPPGGGGWGDEVRDFYNVVDPDGADPWVWKHTDGHYYLAVTTGRDVTLRRSRTLSGMGGAERKVVWTPPPRGRSARTSGPPSCTSCGASGTSTSPPTTAPTPGTGSTSWRTRPPTRSRANSVQGEARRPRWRPLGD